MDGQDQNGHVVRLHNINAFPIKGSFSMNLCVCARARARVRALSTSRFRESFVWDVPLSRLVPTTNE